MGVRNIKEDAVEIGLKKSLAMGIIAVFKYLQDEQAFLGAQAVHWNITQWLRSKAKGRNAAHTIWLVISSLI